MFAINAVNSYNQKQKVSFGTNLILGKGVAEHLATNPSESQAISEFKEQLAKDGKNWNAELTYDTFEPKKVSLEETEKLIRKYVRDYDSEKREQAEKNISQIKDSKVLADFIEKLAKDPDSRVAVAAAEKIGEIKDPKIAVALVEKLIQGQNPDIKEAAVLSLWDIQDKNKELFNNTMEKFINSDDADIKRSAAKTLHKMKDSEHFDKYIEKFNNNADPVIREGVLYAVADIEEEKFGQNPKLYEGIIERGLKDPDAEVRRAAFLSIGKLTDISKAAALIEGVLSSDEEGWQKARAAESIGEIKDPQLVKNLVLKFLESPDSEIRRGAASAVAHIKDEKLQNELIGKIMDSKEAKIRREAAWSINHIEDTDKAIELAEKLLKDPDADVRETMGWHLGFIGDDKISESLISKHINDKDFDVRKGIVDAVDRIVGDNPDKAKEFAQILAKDEDKYIQKKARKILEKIELQSTTDHYNLKMTEGDKLIGNKNVSAKSAFFVALTNAYETIFKKNS